MPPLHGPEPVNRQITLELDLDASDAQPMMEQLRRSLVAKMPAVELIGKVEINKVYIVAGHKGQPVAVSLAKSLKDIKRKRSTTFPKALLMLALVGNVLFLRGEVEPSHVREDRCLPQDGGGRGRMCVRGDLCARKVVPPADEGVSRVPRGGVAGDCMGQSV